MMTLESDGIITIYEIETGRVVTVLEGLEIWDLLRSAPDFPYLPVTGRCLVCGADTLWGDAPHADGCDEGIR